MTREELIDVIKEYFDDQVNRGELSEVPNAYSLACWLIGNGVKVAPVKVGDKVYKPDIMDNSVYEYTVSSIDERNECFTVFCEELEDTYCTTFGSIGTHVCLSREEAEFELEITRKKNLRELLKYHISEEEWDEASEILDLLKNA